MFTGLIQGVGTVAGREEIGDGLSFELEAPRFARELLAGESVAVDGVCLTVTWHGEAGFRVESVRSTLDRTTLAGYDMGRRVNLERALRAGDPLGGHLVQGHVDGVGEVVELGREEETVRLRVRIPVEVAHLTVELGSLAIDGVSLTVKGLERDVAEFAIIPYTWEHTAMDRLHEGALVNVEADVLARYVNRLLGPYSRDRGRGSGSGEEAQGKATDDV
ncbi:MAG: riboflavin synthase [Gemmatimonadota bacterium]